MKKLKDIRYETGQKTGWNSLDATLRGPEGLVIVGARPGMGKSTFGINIAEYVSFHEKKASLIFSLELPEKAVRQRIILSSQKGMMAIYDEPKPDINKIKSIAWEYKQRFGSLGVIVIDYIQLLADYKGNMDTARSNTIGNLYRNLKLLSEELDCPVIALSQLTRKLENRSDRRPKLSDLKASRAAKQSADTIIFLYRDEYYNKYNTKKKGIAEVIIAKNRDSETGTIEMSFQPPIMRFVEKSEAESSRVWE